MIPLSSINRIFENLTAPPSQWSPSDQQTDPEQESRLLSLIRSTTNHVYTSSYYRDFLSRIKEKSIEEVLAEALGSESEFHMVIYGIGSLENDNKSPYQLALALLLRWVIPIYSIEVFDPVLSATECAVLKTLGCNVIHEDERGLRGVTTPTIFFMPHCPVALYDNVIRANWRPEGLNRLVLLGNSFSWYDHQAKYSKSNRSSAYIAASSQYLRAARNRYAFEVPAVVSARESCLGKAFNLLSWHFFYVEEDDDMYFVPTELDEKLLLSGLEH